jgi:hypothetical protein
VQESTHKEEVDGMANKEKGHEGLKPANDSRDFRKRDVSEPINPLVLLNSVGKTAHLPVSLVRAGQFQDKSGWFH